MSPLNEGNKVEISLEEFVTACEDAELNPSPHYSGRGMYGRECIGVTGDARTLAIFLLQVVPKIDPDYLRDEEHHMNAKRAEITIEHAENWTDMRMDNFGTDMIFYWPSIRAVADDTE